MFVKSNWFITSINSLISLLGFCLIDLSIGERGVLNSPTISVCGLMSALSFSNVSFMYVGAFILGSCHFMLISVASLRHLLNLKFSLKNTANDVLISFLFLFFHSKIFTYSPPPIPLLLSTGSSPSSSSLRRGHGTLPCGKCKTLPPPSRLRKVCIQIDRGSKKPVYTVETSLSAINNGFSVRPHCEPRWESLVEHLLFQSQSSWIWWAPIRSGRLS